MAKQNHTRQSGKWHAPKRARDDPLHVGVLAQVPPPPNLPERQQAQQLHGLRSLRRHPEVLDQRLHRGLELCVSRRQAQYGHALRDGMVGLLARRAGAAWGSQGGGDSGGGPGRGGLGFGGREERAEQGVEAGGVALDQRGEEGLKALHGRMTVVWIRSDCSAQKDLSKLGVALDERSKTEGLQERQGLGKLWIQERVAAS